MKSTKTRVFIFVTIGFSAFIGLMCAEALVRIMFRYNSPETIRANSLQYSTVIFARHLLKPNQLVRVDEAWGVKSDVEKTNRTYAINEYGYRGTSFLARKPKGMYRIVILGGSAVFDVYASEGRDWPHLVELLLKTMGHNNVEVINAGIPGHASFDSLGRLYSQIWMFEPDYILVYAAWNDIKYFGTLAPEKPLISHFLPYNDTADPFQNYQGFFDRLLSTSQLYIKIRNYYLISKYNPGSEGEIPRGAYQSDPIPSQFGIKQYKLNIGLIVDASRNIGAVPILLTQATLVSPDNTEDDRKRIAYDYQHLSNETLVKVFADMSKVILTVAQEKKADVIDIARNLSGKREFFEDHVHTTKRGSEEIAKAVAGFLAKKLNQRTSN